ncbi:MAG: imidazoleglycerol-phosphate dehydratase HisB [Gammaproteobacteria bacterium]|nr:imidazoleglycerol-phosphate dehydratase HisB [Gammaproteobacteria bacterium]
MNKRVARISRETTETSIEIALGLDGSGQGASDIGIPFLEHMLDQVRKHGCFDLDIKARGDLAVDFHHTVEDIGITLGQCFSKALADKKGIYRYGHAYVPLDEALSRAVIDFSGRPGLTYKVSYPRARIGYFYVYLLHYLFKVFANHAYATVQLDNIRGSNAHHIAETLFKAFARACRTAVATDPRMASELPSTKGKL